MWHRKLQFDERRDWLVVPTVDYRILESPISKGPTIMPDHTQRFFIALLCIGAILATDSAREPVSTGDRPECRSVAARYPTRQRTSNFFMRSRISSVRGA